MNEEVYEIDEETMETCKALEFYDKHRHLPSQKKKVLLSLSYKATECLRDKKNKSKFVDELIIKSAITTRFLNSVIL